MSVRFGSLVSEELIKLDLAGETKDEILRELVSLLNLNRNEGEDLLHYLKRLQHVGSTGIGRGIAIVYARHQAFTRVCLGFGRQNTGVDFAAFDGKPVQYFVLIFGPQIEAGDENWFLPVVGRVAKRLEEADAPDRMAMIDSHEAFVRWLEEEGDFSPPGAPI